MKYKNHILYTDIDECRGGGHECGIDQDCINTRGSYQCKTRCSLGLQQQADGSCTGILVKCHK